MDELEFRRRIYADPKTTDQEVLLACNQSPERKRFVREVQGLDGHLARAANVSVPDNLADKLIWMQRTQTAKNTPRASKPILAIAASIALLIGVGITTSLPFSGDINQQVLAHMSHVDREISASNEPVELAQINAKLATFDISLAAMIDNVVAANYCYLSTVKSLHLIIATESGPLSVFFIPNQHTRDLQYELSDDHYHGQTVSTQKASIVVVGNTASNITPMIEAVTQNLRFSA